MYPTDKFYNMRVNLIKNGKTYSEKAAVRNIWQKERSILVDIYIYRLQKAFVFDSVFIHDIWDLSRDICYKDMRKFAADFAAAADIQKIPPAKNQTAAGDILTPVKDDVILLLFMSKVWDDKNNIQFEQQWWDGLLLRLCPPHHPALYDYGRWEIEDRQTGRIITIREGM